MPPTALAMQAAEPGEFTTDTSAGTRQTRWARWAGRVRPYAPDLAVCTVYLLVAAWLTHGLWPDPTNRSLALNPEDQILIEWFLANDTRLLLDEFSLYSDRLNAPDGFNMLANATVILPGILLTPITLLFGAPTSFALLVAGNLAATAIGWYLLYARTLDAHRFAAAIGAGFCGFAPGMISQSNSHPHMTAQWLVPAIVWAVLRMVRAADPGGAGGRSSVRRLVVTAATLAALVSLQVFVGEEVLFLTAAALALLALGYVVADPAYARRILPRFSFGMLMAVGLAAAALAVPLWIQFNGPQSVPNGPFSPDYFSADLASYPAFSPLSAAGSPENGRLSTGAAEYNTFLGLPLLLVTAVCVGWLRGNRLVLAMVPAGLVAAWLSLGPRVVVDGVRTDVWAPYELLRDVPVVDGALPMRFALVLIPLIATVLVVATDRALRSTGLASLVVPGAVVAALLPIAPTPLPAETRAPVPSFITAGHWRECVPPDGVLVPVPLPTPKRPETMRWAAAADAQFRLPEGFFIGPYAARGRASLGTYKQPTSALLAEVAEKGQLPVLTDRERAQAVRDLSYWGASCVVLADAQPNAALLRETLTALLGPGTHIADAWIWRV